uniref:Putative lipocalin-5 1 n=1 Tax=Rhipicephalus microplus TaxID=6941 RepID=A0A6M2D4B8_RHIMP
MRLLSRYRATLVFCAFYSTLSTQIMGEKVHGTATAFTVFENFPFALAVFDMDQDGDLDCVSAIRTQFDKSEPSATYVWMFKGNNPRNVTFHIKPGPTFDTSTYTMDDDYEHEYHANFYFSDYKNCVIFGMPHLDTDECMLWVTKKVKDDVPPICTDKYKENCDMQVMAYDQETCGEYADYE